MRLTKSQLSELNGLMEDCGQAMFDDCEWNAPVYRDGEVVGANGTNPSDAAQALNAVASILGIDTPRDHLDLLERHTQ